MTLPPPGMEERIFLRPRGKPGRGGTAALSAVAHLAVLWALLTVATQVPPAPPEPPAIPLLFSAPAPSPAAPVQTTVPLASVQLARPAPQASALATAVAPRAAFHIARSMPAPRARTPAATPRQAAPPPPSVANSTPGAAPQTDDAEAQRIETARLTDSIHAAVQAFAVMPPVARRQHREGRAQVRFAYLDGAVAEIALARSSQSLLLDDAALAAVARARYPAPPPPLRGHKIPMVLWIEFRMANSSADS